MRSIKFSMAASIKRIIQFNERIKCSCYSSSDAACTLRVCVFQIICCFTFTERLWQSSWSFKIHIVHLMTTSGGSANEDKILSKQFSFTCAPTNLKENAKPRSVKRKNSRNGLYRQQFSEESSVRLTWIILDSKWNVLKCISAELSLLSAFLINSSLNPNGIEIWKLKFVFFLNV